MTFLISPSLYLRKGLMRYIGNRWLMTGYLVTVWSYGSRPSKSFLRPDSKVTAVAFTLMTNYRVLQCPPPISLHLLLQGPIGLGPVSHPTGLHILLLSYLLKISRTPFKKKGSCSVLACVVQSKCEHHFQNGHNSMCPVSKMAATLVLFQKAQEWSSLWRSSKS